MRLRLLALSVALTLLAGAASAQIVDTAKRRVSRDQLAAFLTSYGPTVNITFRPSDKNPFNFIGTLNGPFANVDSFEVICAVSEVDTIAVRVYPRYQGRYINIDKARSPAALSRKVAELTYRNFMAWSIDNDGDILSQYLFTLESGFPEQAFRVVLSSIKRLDEYVGRMRFDYDGTDAK